MINVPHEVLFDTHMSADEATIFARKIVDLGYYYVRNERHISRIDFSRKNGDNLHVTQIPTKGETCNESHTESYSFYDENKHAAPQQRS